MKRRSLGGLRARLILLVLLAVVPALGLTLYTGLEQRRLAADNAHANALRLGRFALADQQALIDKTRQVLATLAQLSVVRDSEAGTCDTFLAGVSERYWNYSGVFVASRDGEITCTGVPVSPSINLADAPWFQRVLETADFTVGEYVIAQGSGKPVLPVAYPILGEDEEVQAVVATGLDLTHLSLFASAIELPSNSTLTVIDRAGTVLARYPDSDAWIGRSMPEVPIVQKVLATDDEGTAEARGGDGVSRLFAFMPLRGTSEGGGTQDGDLYVIAGIPASVVFAESNGIFVRNLIGLGLVAILALAAAWLGGDQFLRRPVTTLGRAAEQVTAGDLSVRAGPPYTSGELGQLARAFDQMTETLQQRETERAEAEEALRRSEERHRLLIEAVQDYAIIMLDPDGHVMSWNEGAERIKGYQRSEIIGQHFSRFYPPEAVEAGLPDRALKTAAEEGRYDDEGWRVRKDGSRFWAMVVITALRGPEGELRGFSKVVRDITDRKRAEDELRESERRLAEAQRLAHLGNWEWNVRANTLRWSAELQRIYGVEEDDFDASYEDFLERVHPEDRERVRRVVAQAYEDHQPFDFEHRIVRPNGVVRTLHGRGQVVVDEAGELLKMVGTGQDITERKQMEVELRKLSRAVHHSSAAVFIYNAEGEIEYVNPRFSELTGYSPSDILGNHVSTLGENAVELNEQLWNVISAGKRWQGEILNRRKDGERYWALASIAPIKDPNGNVTHFVEIHEDITERKQMEAELAEMQHRLAEAREAERLHLARELHDGPVQDLHALDFQLQSLSGSFPEDGRQADVEDVQTTVHDVTRALRVICGELRPPTLAPFGLSVAIRSHAERFGEENPELEIDLDLMPDEQSLPEQMRLALFRIYQQAMDNVVQHAQASHVLVRFTLDESEATLDVQDDGRGFSVPKRWIGLARRGHLGLVGIAERAEAIGGQLDVESEPGEGTLIRVVAPRPSHTELGE